MDAKRIILSFVLLNFANMYAPVALKEEPAVQKMAPAVGDRITVHNQTPRDLYVGIYYLRMKMPWEDEYQTAKLASPVQFVESHASGIVQRPVRKVGYDRELVFLEDKNLFKPELPYFDVKEKYNSKNVGDLQGDVFYIGEKEGIALGYTTVEWNVNKALLDKAQELVFKQLPAINENPYRGQPAQVRVGNELPEAEKTYLTRRLPRVKQAEEKLIGAALGQPVKIALIMSGGGTRAMLYTLGVLRALEQAGILNAVIYIATLSGSTWGVSSWYASGVPLPVFCDWITDQLSNGVKNVSSDDAALIGQMLITKYLFEQPLGPVDLYGALLANTFLDKQGAMKQRRYLSDQAKIIESGQFPMPIYTAVRAESLAVENMWYEFTPYEVGGSWLGMYVPARAFGAKFRNGNLVRTDTPELSLGNLMGIWGFALGASITRMLQEVDLEKKMPVQFAKNIVLEIDEQVGAFRPFEAKVLNFTRDMPNSPVKDVPFLSLTDAGVSYSNLPYQPVSGQRPGRDMDILICVDASDNLLSIDPTNPRSARVSSLKIIEDYAHSHKLSFPKIIYDQVMKKSVSIFKDEKNAKVPVVIYMPRIADQKALKELEIKRADLKSKIQQFAGFDIETCFRQGVCASENFTYSSDQAKNVMLMGELNCYSAIDTIIENIKWISQRKDNFIPKE
jgi:hypothetical protein